MGLFEEVRPPDRILLHGNVLLEIAAGREGLSRAGDQDRAHAVVLGALPQPLPEALQHLQAERIQRLRPVQCQHRGVGTRVSHRLLVVQNRAF